MISTLSDKQTDFTSVTCIDLKGKSVSTESDFITLIFQYIITLKFQVRACMGNGTYYFNITQLIQSPPKESIQGDAI